MQRITYLTVYFAAPSPAGSIAPVLPPHQDSDPYLMLKNKNMSSTISPAVGHEAVVFSLLLLVHHIPVHE